MSINRVIRVLWNRSGCGEREILQIESNDKNLYWLSCNKVAMTKEELLECLQEAIDELENKCQ